MAKSVHNDVLDAALNFVKNNATRFVICSDHPTTFTEAMTTYNLATKTISSSDFGSPADNDGGGGGRMIQVNAANSLTVDADGSGEFFALVDFDDEKVLYVTEADSPQNLYEGNTANVAAWNIRIQDPV